MERIFRVKTETGYEEFTDEKAAIKFESKIAKEKEKERLFKRDYAEIEEEIEKLNRMLDEFEKRHGNKAKVIIYEEENGKKCNCECESNDYNKEDNDDSNFGISTLDQLLDFIGYRQR